MIRRSCGKLSSAVFDWQGCRSERSQQRHGRACDFERTTVDLIICDLNVMDGIEFVRRVRHVENAKYVPVVIISSEGGESQVLKALSAGARGYIRKPFTPDQVKEHILPLLAAVAE